MSPTRSLDPVQAPPANRLFNMIPPNNSPFRVLRTQKKKTGFSFCEERKLTAMERETATLRTCSCMI